MNQAARTSVDQRQCGRNHGMIGSAETDLLREREAEDGTRF